MTSHETPPRGLEARRLWILEEAERLCLPAFLTPRWRSLYVAARTPRRLSGAGA